MRVLIATDGGTQAPLALAMARHLAALAELHLTLLTVVAHERQRAQGEAMLQEMLAAQASVAGETAVSSQQILVRVGQPAQEIQQAAAAADYDLVLLGACPERHTLGLWRDKVCARLMQTLRCPLLVAKGTIRPLQSILICESGGPQPTLLSRLMQRLPQLLRPPMCLSVLHVMSQISAGPQVSGWELKAPAQELIKAHTLEGELLAQDLRLLEQMPLEVTPVVRHGLVVDEVVAEAEAGEYGLVVIGAYHPQGWERLLLSDQARQIVYRAPCPILVMQ